MSEEEVFIGKYRELEISKLDKTLELYTKLREKETIEPEDVDRMTFDFPKNTFKVDNMNYKETRKRRMELIKWFDLLRELDINTHLESYRTDCDYKDISCHDEKETIEYEEEMKSWKMEICVFIYKEPKEQAFKIGVEGHGTHTYDKNSDCKKNDKCELIFYFGDFELTSLISCKGYNLDEEKDTIKIVERAVEAMENQMDSEVEFPEYFIKYNKITQLGRKIMKTIVKKYLKIIKYNASNFSNFEEN
jgi:hypothetical protein